MKEKVRDLGIEEDDPLQTTMRTLTMHLDLVSYHMKDVFGEIFHSNDMSYMHERWVSCCQLSTSYIHDKSNKWFLMF